MSSIRVGWGMDAHRFSDDPPIVLGGVVASETQGIDATSDGDLVVHALIDGMLGAAALGDLGTHFPSSDPAWHDVDSFRMLAMAVDLIGKAGLAAGFVDVTIVAQDVKVAPIRDAIRRRLSEALSLDLRSVSVKATTTDHMGFVGRGEGMAAFASVTLVPSDAPATGGATHLS